MTWLATIQLGTLPEWFAAVGTVGALFVSLWLLKEQRDDRQADKEEKRPAQARKVSIWADGVQDNGANFIVSYIAQNASGDPIYGTSEMSGVYQPSPPRARGSCLPRNNTYMWDRGPGIQVGSWSRESVSVSSRWSQMLRSAPN